MRAGLPPRVRPLAAGSLGATVWALVAAAIAPTASGQARFESGRQDTRPSFRGFVENAGQWPVEAALVGQIDELLIRAEPTGFVLQKTMVQGGQQTLGVVRLDFEGAVPVRPRGEALLPSRHHYFLGRDPSGWYRNVSAYESVDYACIYEDISLRLYCAGGQLEYDVVFGPSARIDDFVIRCDGIDGMDIDPNGSLWLFTPVGPILQQAPVAWFESPDGTIPATCSFRIIDGNRFGLTVAERIASATLVVDPGLTWSTFLGGMDLDSAQAVEVVSGSAIVVAGATRSFDFPTTAGTYDVTVADQDATISCFDLSGGLLFSTYFGGSDRESASVLSSTSGGEIAFGGFTQSSDLPLSAGAFDSTLAGSTDAFVAMLSADGAQLLFSTYCGGDGGCSESLYGLKVTSGGMIVCAGRTCHDAIGFPVTPSSFDPSENGGIDSFVTWFDPTASGPAQLVCSTFLGGTSHDIVLDLALGSGDQPIVVGNSGSLNFPTTPGTYDETPGGDFITRFTADGSGLVASTRYKDGIALVVTADGDSVLIGGRAGLAFPASPDAFDSTLNGAEDAFVARLDGGLGDVLRATLIGGSEMEAPSGLIVDESGGIIMIGGSASSNYPTTPGAYDTEKGGSAASSVPVISYFTADLTELRYSTFLGPAAALTTGASDVDCFGMADVVVVGFGAGPGFPTTPGAFDPTFNGGGLGDAFVARMLLATTWNDLGGAVAGTNGVPTLDGSGNLSGGSSITVTLRHALPGAISTLVIGTGLLNAPFKGGLMMPVPLLLLPGLTVGPGGAIALGATWPSGLPPDFGIYLQYWIVDPAGSAGLAASNGLWALTP